MKTLLKPFLRIFFVTAGFFSATCALGQSAGQALGQGAGRLSGSFETNSIWYFPDRTATPSDRFGSNNYMKLDYSQGNFYMFTPENKRASAKYATIGECAHWRFAAPAQMTPGIDSGFC